MPVIKNKNNDFTSYNKRLWSFLMKLKRKEEYKNDLKQIRNDFAIPQNGFSKNKTQYDLYQKISFIPPKEWIQQSLHQKRLLELHQKIKWFISKHKLGVLSGFPDVLNRIIFYNLYSLPDNINNVVLREIKDIDRELKFYKLNKDSSFPIAILITPHTSNRDIQDFLTKNKTSLDILKNKYLNKTLPIKNTNTREPKKETKHILKLNQENLSIKEIAREVNKKFGTNYGESDINRKIHHHIKSR